MLLASDASPLDEPPARIATGSTLPRADGGPSPAHAGLSGEGSGAATNGTQSAPNPPEAPEAPARLPPAEEEQYVVDLTVDSDSDSQPHSKPRSGSGAAAAAGLSRLTSKQQSPRAPKRRLKRKEVPERIKKKVAADQEWRCNECKDVLKATYQVDHIVPVSLDGTNEPSNLQALCPNCHALKTQQQSSFVRGAGSLSTREKAERARRMRMEMARQADKRFGYS